MTTALKSHATPMPIAMSVNMLSAAIHERLPAADEERPARPQHDGRAERELHPARRIAVEPRGRAGEKMTHRDQEHRQRQRRADPEPPRHVAQLGILISAPGRRCFSAPAPCRTSGNSPDDPARSPGASGTCRWSLRQASTSGCAPTPCRISDKCPARRSPRPRTSGRSISSPVCASPRRSLSHSRSAGDGCARARAPNPGHSNSLPARPKANPRHERTRSDQRRIFAGSAWSRSNRSCRDTPHCPRQIRA